jgi:hypothetical protein
MVTERLTPLGELLEAARGSTSKRAAARAAEISEGRWRQVVTGVQKAGGGIEIPVNPRRETVKAMAVAVGADVERALTLAGFEPTAAELADTTDPDELKIRRSDLPPDVQEVLIAALRHYRNPGDNPGPDVTGEHDRLATGP